MGRKAKYLINVRKEGRRGNKRKIIPLISANITIFGAVLNYFRKIMGKILLFYDPAPSIIILNVFDR